MPQREDYLANITSEHQGQPDFTAMVSLFVQPFVDNQNTWAQIPFMFNLDTATQYTLPETNFIFDWIGEWVGLSRSGLSDTDYQTLLYLQIAINRWDGTVPGLYSAWQTVFAGAVNLLVQDNQDMSMFIVFNTHPFSPTVTALILSGQFDMRPAGVRMTGYFASSSAAQPVFGLGVDNSSIAGLGVGYIVAPLT
jgi:hypothetical protein